MEINTCKKSPLFAKRGASMVYALVGSVCVGGWGWGVGVVGVLLIANQLRRDPFNETSNVFIFVAIGMDNISCHQFDDKLLPKSILTYHQVDSEWPGIQDFAACHYSDVIMRAMASQIAGVSIVCTAVCSDKKTHQSFASLAFVRGIHRWPVNSPHKGSVTRKMFPFDTVIILSRWPCRVWRNWSFKVVNFVTLWKQEQFAPYFFISISKCFLLSMKHFAFWLNLCVSILKLFTSQIVSSCTKYCVLPYPYYR